MEQPQCFSVKGQEDKVYLLKKALYGLKQTPKAWYSQIDEHLQGLGFKKRLSDSTLFIKKKKGDSDIVVLSLYFDDLILTGDNLS